MPELKMNKKERQNLDFLVSQYNRYRDSLRPRVDDWKRYYKVAKAFKELGTYGYKYDVNKPVALLFIENFVSSVVNPIFENRDLVDIQPAEQFGQVEGVDDTKVAQQLNRAINRMLANPDNKFRQSITDMVKSLAYYGTAIAQVFPRFGRQDDGYPYLGPDVKLQQVYNVLPNPEFQMLEETTDLFIREIVTPAELRRREQTMNYKRVEDAIAQTGDYNQGEEDVKRDLEAEGSGLDGYGRTDNFNQGDGPDRKIFLAHYYDANGGVRIMANNQVIVFNSLESQTMDLQDGGKIKLPQIPFHYYPFESLRINEGPAEFYGIGIAQLIEMTQSLINIRAAQRNENIELALQKCFIVSRYAGINMEEINMIPGGLIPTDNMDGIQPLEVTDITKSSYQEDAADMTFAEELVSVQQISRGGTPERRITATTGAQLLQTAQQRTNTLQANIMDSIISISRKIAIQIRSYMNKQEYERLLGEPDAGLFQLTPTDLNLFMDYTPLFRGNDQAKSQRLQNLMTFYQMAIQDPLVNRQQLLQEIGAELFPNKDPKRYILLPDQAMIQQFITQMMASQQGQEGGTSQPGAVPPTQQKSQGNAQGDSKRKGER